MRPFDSREYDAIHLQKLGRHLLFENIHPCAPNLILCVQHAQRVASQNIHDRLFRPSHENILIQQYWLRFVYKNLEPRRPFVQIRVFLLSL